MPGANTARDEAGAAALHIEQYFFGCLVDVGCISKINDARPNRLPITTSSIVTRRISVTAIIAPVPREDGILQAASPQSVLPSRLQFGRVGPSKPAFEYQRLLCVAINYSDFQHLSPFPFIRLR